MLKLIVSQLSTLVGPRGRHIANVAGWSLVAKLTSAANLFIAVPFVLDALGPIEFGAWATLVSLVVFVGFLDFGIGNGAMNLVAAAYSREDSRQIISVIREGRRTLLIISAVLALLCVAMLYILPWYRLLGLPVAMADSSRLAVAAVLLSVVIAIPLNLAVRVQLGLRRGGSVFRWQALGQLVTLALIIVLSRTQNSLPVLTATAVLTPLISPLAITIVLAVERSDVFKGGRRPDIGRRIRKEGGMFFLLQLAAALAFSADLPLIAALSGPEEAGTYAVVQRAYSVVPLGLAMVWTPLWPLYRQGLAVGDRNWVIRTLRHSVIFAVCIAAIIAFAISLGFERLTELWLGHPVGVPMVMLAGFAAWVVLEAIGNALATLLNAASVLRFQVIIGGFFALSCVIGKTLVVANGNIGWLPWMTFYSWLVFAFIPLVIYRRKIYDSIFIDESNRHI